jgi:predicted transcriptional regulator
MKTFTFRYEKNPRKQALAAMKEAIQSGVTDVRDDEMVCDSMDSMLKLMSKSRFDVFAAIVEHKPESLYQLAQVLQKDQGNVLRDARALAALGLIELVSVMDGERERLKPQALYDKIVIEFEPKKLANAAGS